jgi:ABC-type branched-subunit amino acid transport system ATPase component
VATLEERAAGALLEVEALSFSYDTLQVLSDVSMTVQPGEMVGLLGTNGAGKSTLLRALSGLARPAAGTVHFAGQEITGVPAERLVRLGVAMVPGGKAVFPDLTVLENIEVGSQLLDPATAASRMERELERFPILRGLARRRAATLSGGEQQCLAIAKAMLLDCRLLCIDELSLGLSPLAVDEVIAVLRGVNAAGVAMLIVEQSLNVAAAICTRALFLEKGTVRFEGSPSELAQRGDLARAVFLGAAEVAGAGNGRGRSSR